MKDKHYNRARVFIYKICGWFFYIGISISDYIPPIRRARLQRFLEELDRHGEV